MSQAEARLRHHDRSFAGRRLQRRVLVVFLHRLVTSHGGMLGLFGAVVDLRNHREIHLRGLWGLAKLAVTLQTLRLEILEP